jgi:hypothetical protein
VSGHYLGKHSLGVLPPPDATRPRPWPPRLRARILEVVAAIQDYGAYDDPRLYMAMAELLSIDEQLASLDRDDLASTAEGQLQHYQRTGK